MQYTYAQNVQVYGKFDWGAYTITGNASSTAAFKNGAGIVTAHTNGLGGNLPGFATFALDTGVSYTFNGTTTKPFPEAVSAGRIYASNLSVNAGISINKQVYVSNTLTITSGNLTIPVADSIIITSGIPVAGAPFSATKHIVTATDTSSGAQGLLGIQNINTTYLLPVGSNNNYLPVTLQPQSASSYTAGVFEGITANGRSNGTALTQVQKQNTVNAVWTIARTSTNTDSCNITLAWPQALEGNNFNLGDSLGIAAYTTAWGTTTGTGDNTNNTATQLFRTFSAFAVGAKGYTLGNGPAIAFTSGNIVVSRIGAGVSGPFSGTNNVYLDEYTATGAFVRTLALPTTPGSALLQSNAIDEGRLTRSVDGHYLTLAGYSKSASSTAYSTTAVVTPRSVGAVKYDGTMNVLVPTVTTPVASTSGTVVTGSPTSLTVSSATGIATGQYVYGSYVPNNATVASVSGTSVTLSGSGGTNGGSSFVFMSAATPQYANIKSPGAAITTNGTDFWLCSRETSLQYYNSSTGTLTNIAGGNTGAAARFFNIIDSQLYTSNDFGLKLAKVGTGIPTTPTTTGGLSYASGSFAPVSPTQFCMVDASGTESGSDVLYVAETGSGTGSYGILKYTKVSGLWTSNGGYGSYTDVYQGLTGVLNGSTVTLYAIRKTTTAASGELVKIIDAGAYNTTMSGTETVLAAYNTNNNLGGSWRSIAFAPTSTNNNNAVDSPVSYGALPTANADVKLYPNPVTDHLTVEQVYKPNTFLAVYDLQGKLLLKQPVIATSTQLNVAALPAGVYLLISSDGTHSTSQKFTTYYWVGGASANYDQAASWNTVLGGGGSTRTTIASNDILVFDGSNYGTPSVTSATVYNLPAQTLNKLQLKNNVNVIFASAATASTTPVSGLASKSGHTITGNGSTNFPTDFAVGDFTANSQWGAQMSLITAVSGNILTTAETGSYGNSSHYKASTLRISQSNGLVIEAGSSLSVTLNNAPFAITLLSGASALIQGSITLQPSATQACRLVAIDASGIVVDSAAMVTDGPNNRGNIFSTNAVTTNNNIVFKKGSTYWHNPVNASSSENQVPFGSTVTGPQSVIDLQTGSKIIYSTTNGASFAGFKYGNVEIQTNLTTTASPTSLGDLIIDSGFTFINNSLTSFPVSGNITNNGNINTSVASTLLLCGTSHQTVGGTGNYFLNGLTAAVGTDVTLAHNIQMLSTTTFDSTHAITVNASQVLSSAPNASVGVTMNNFLEGSGTTRTTSFPTAIKQMGMKTLRFQEGEFGDWYLWSKSPYTTPNPHAAMWGGSLFPFNQSNIFIIGDTTVPSRLI
ncbi:hypothetical protein F5148DRAFT_1295809 [Russula earlei]|uniref:Uncharacterized protein n=1 Tax=Russula earlei TaxID=71964 RepID=A0ACC0TRX6_9AGAM|nr:hypothetical protein F5148DRAFT_1295809 [Russula earlei]